jgi:hypothetical protein
MRKDYKNGKFSTGNPLKEITIERSNSAGGMTY